MKAEITSPIQENLKELSRQTVLIDEQLVKVQEAEESENIVKETIRRKRKAIQSLLVKIKHGVPRSAQRKAQRLHLAVLKNELKSSKEVLRKAKLTLSIQKKKWNAEKVRERKLKTLISKLYNNPKNYPVKYQKKLAEEQQNSSDNPQGSSGTQQSSSGKQQSSSGTQKSRYVQRKGIKAKILKIKTKNEKSGYKRKNARNPEKLEKVSTQIAPDEQNNSASLESNSGLADQLDNNTFLENSSNPETSVMFHPFSVYGAPFQLEHEQVVNKQEQDQAQNQIQQEQEQPQQNQAQAQQDQKQDQAPVNQEQLQEQAADPKQK